MPLAFRAITRGQGAFLFAAEKDGGFWQFMVWFWQFDLGLIE
jgi:hypothetical protein